MQIEVEEGDLSEMGLIQNSQSVIVVTHGGYMKRMQLKTFEGKAKDVERDARRALPTSPRITRLSTALHVTTTIHC